MLLILAIVIKTPWSCRGPVANADPSRLTGLRMILRTLAWALRRRDECPGRELFTLHTAQVGPAGCP